MEEAIRKANNVAPASAAAVVPGGTKVLPHKSGKHSPSKPKPITTAQVWLLFRRACVLGAAIWYMISLIEGGIKAVEVLYEVTDDSLKYPSLSSNLIAPYAGTHTIRRSKLVEAIGGTEPRNGTVYLLSPTTTNNASCVGVPAYNPRMYGDKFLRAQFADLVRDASYNMTLLKTAELVTPVVDCTTFMLRTATVMYMRAFFLLRSLADPDEMFLMTYSLSTQDYKFPDQYQNGVAGVLVLSVVSDMRFNTVDSYHYALTLGYPFRRASYSLYEYKGDTDDEFRIFESILPPNSADATRVIYTSWRTGIFQGSEEEQSNIKNINWIYNTNPVAAMTDWQWKGVSVLHDAWAWTHAMHFVFAADMAFSLIVLLMVIFRNARRGKLWIGDAFVSVSRSLSTTGILVFVGWCVNGFWTVMEFCIQDGKILAGMPVMFIYEEILHADLMVIYVSLAGLLGFILRERIDPALAVFLYEIAFSNRHAMAKWFPSVLKTITTFTAEDAAEGMVPVPTKLAGISPLRFRSTHDFHARPISFVLATLSPVLLTFCVLVVYVPARKIYRRFFPDRMVQLSRGTGMSTESDAILAWKSTLTMFEVATGAALQNRCGLVTDYDNCVYIKGIKFASADGIYCNGFVVAHGKWLLRTSDLAAILAMKITRVRFADVYVFEVDSFTVQKNARLFYPEMVELKELFQLNTMILA